MKNTKTLAVYRYQLTSLGVNTALMIEGAEILTAVRGSSGAYLTALVDPTVDSMEPRNFIVAKTGQTLPASIAKQKHIASIAGGIHVFEVDQKTADAFTELNAVPATEEPKAE